MVEHLLKKQDKKQCQLENQILKLEQHLEQDIVVTHQDLKQWLDIGLVKNGNLKTSTKKLGGARYLSYLIV